MKIFIAGDMTKAEAGRKKMSLLEELRKQKMEAGATLVVERYNGRFAVFLIKS